MDKKYVIFRQLTPIQAQQVAREYPAGTDPWHYEYQIGGNERVTDRYYLSEQELQQREAMLNAEAIS